MPMKASDPLMLQKQRVISHEAALNRILAHSPRNLWNAPDVASFVLTLYQLCRGLGLDFTIMLSIAVNETDWFSQIWWRDRFNPASIGVSGVPAQDAASPNFKNGKRAAQFFVLMMLTKIEKGIPAEVERYAAWAPKQAAHTAAMAADPTFPDVRTLDDLQRRFGPNNRECVWACSGDNAASVVEKSRAIFPDLIDAKGAQTMPANEPKRYPIVGLPGPGILSPVPISHDIIPASQKNQRPGIARHLPGDWVQHETDNHAPGTGAEMHARFLHNGARNDEGKPQKLSFHFAVDDGVIIQLIPIDEVTWQAADGAGPGNMGGISCELCVNAGIDTAKARHNAEALCGGILAALHMGPTHIKRHWDFNGALPPNERHHCPDDMMNENYWPTFVANASKIAGGIVTPPTQPPAEFAPRMPIPGPVESKTINGHPFARGVGRLTFAEDTAPKQYADPDSAETGKPRKKGSGISPQYWTVGADGALWAVEGGSNPGNRFPYAAFVEGRE